MNADCLNKLELHKSKNSGFEKKLIGGVVLTGGGSELKHIDQLAEFMIGKDTRIGYPNEHLANDVPDEMATLAEILRRECEIDFNPTSSYQDL